MASLTSNSNVVLALEEAVEVVLLTTTMAKAKATIKVRRSVGSVAARRPRTLSSKLSSLMTTLTLLAMFSDWQGFRQPAGFWVWVVRGQVQVGFCAPGQYPYLQQGFYKFAMGFQYISMFTNNEKYTLCLL